jgi:hypothetical protein
VRPDGRVERRLCVLAKILRRQAGARRQRRAPARAEAARDDLGVGRGAPRGGRRVGRRALAAGLLLLPAAPLVGGAARALGRLETLQKRRRAAPA